ncbi:MAG: CCA tRNA nucleotidyltransferase [Clostridia bacterium]|nr:CCA tRNA nucleotidyltransferase [Clostridia bacterium]MBQ9737745.1 CCA tRNA nucleotidyltransferase [Clostridia bacterium]
MRLPEFVCKAMKKLEEGGFQAFVVGGPVRDLLLGSVPFDWDIATSALPEEVMEVFSEYRVIPTGIKHGTVTLVSEDGMIEITTFRTEGAYVDNRHPQNVTFSGKIEEDLKRRDFTINALAYNSGKGVLDLFGGKADLERKTIRCVGQPDKRFGEDALRIMRALRFSAVLGFEIEEDTAKGIFSCRELLKNISAERIAIELSKLIMAENPRDVLLKYRVVFEEIFEIDLEEDIWSESVEAASRAEKNLSVRLALILRGKTAEVLKRLKYDNKTMADAVIAAKYLDINLSPEPYLIKKELSAIGEKALRLALAAKKACFDASNDNLLKVENALNHILREGECFSIRQLDIKGGDVCSIFEAQGKKVGLMLDVLLDAVIRGQCQNKKENLISYLKDYILNQNGGLK